MRYEFDAPHPRETLDEFLRRHKAHPDQPDRREATDEEEADCDKTEEYVGQAIILTGIGPPPRAMKKRDRR